MTTLAAGHLTAELALFSFDILLSSVNENKFMKRFTYMQQLQVGFHTSENNLLSYNIIKLIQYNSNYQYYKINNVYLCIV